MNQTKIISILLLAALLLGACAPAAPAASATTITDGLGREISLDEPAQSIISLSPPFTEILFAIGAGDLLAARDSFSDYPEDALGLPDIGGGFAEYDLESMVALEPDLVLAGDIQTPELVQSIEDLGLKVFYINNPASLEEMLETIRTIGVISGHGAEADQVVGSLEARIQAVDDTLAEIDAPVTLFYELDASDPAKPYTPGPGSFYSHLIQRAGGENIGDELGTEWAQASVEFLLVKDPQYIILGDAMWGVTPEAVAARPGWDALSAVQAGRVLPFDDNLMARIGPRQVDGLEALARLLHPQAFE